MCEEIIDLHINGALMSIWLTTNFQYFSESFQMLKKQLNEQQLYFGHAKFINLIKSC